MKTSRFRSVICLVLIAAISSIVAGCGDARRQSVSGTVTFDGQPLKEGSIRFIPTEGAEGPSAGADIIDGKFEIPKDVGTFAGKFQVQVTAKRPSQRLARNPETGRMERGFEQYIPAKYNRRTELVEEVKVGEDNVFAFELTSR